MSLVFLFLTLFFGPSATIAHGKNYQTFDVTKYGAISYGKAETSQAFMKAWTAACQWNGKAMVYIPGGEYVLDSVEFGGPCKGFMAFRLEGTLKAANKLNNNNDQWINFKYIDNFVLDGGGTLDGQGNKVWDARKTCKSNCWTLPISLGLAFINNGKINHISSINSQNAHFSLFGCNNISLNNLRLSAPFDSPNTDGIKIGESQNIKISQTTIGTGDDCISLLAGSKNINISDVFCGPGHGISVGSMGGTGDYKNDTVVGLTVKNCTFSNTSNGIRIKTRASSISGVASDFTFQDIVMHNVNNPIIIDQKYCPYPPCDTTTPSHIQIKNVSFNNIWGTSTSKVAITLNCSRTFPCKDLVLKDISLMYHGDGGSATSLCSYAEGNSYGHQSPPACIH